MEVFQLFQQYHQLVVVEVVALQVVVDPVDQVVAECITTNQEDLVIHLPLVHLKEIMVEQETLM